MTNRSIFSRAVLFTLSGTVFSHGQIALSGPAPLTDIGIADDWSSIVVSESAILEPGNGRTTGRVTTFNFIADDGRLDSLEAQSHRLIPLLVETNGGPYTIIGIGRERIPTTSGSFSFPFDLVDGTNVIDTSSGSSFHIAVLQQRDDQEDVASGAIPYSESGGTGYVLMNTPGPNFRPALNDTIQIDFGSDPGGRQYAFNFEIDFTPRIDTDMDGMPDDWEDRFSLDKNEPADATENADADTLTNKEEFDNGTDPTMSDTDGDTLNDDIEVNNLGTNPRLKDTDGDRLDDNIETNTGTWISATDTGTNPLLSDTDGDTLKDNVETNTGIFVSISDTGTNPLLPDSDGDRASDGNEVHSGFDPTDLNDMPNDLAAGQQVITGVGVEDSDTPFIYFDEFRPFNFLASPNFSHTASEISFHATKTTGVVTPLLAEATAPNEFIIRAIGTPRIGGTDWTTPGTQTFPFSDTDTVSIQSGWVAGFATYDPANPTNTGSVIPYLLNGGVDGWLLISLAPATPPTIQLNQPPGTEPSYSDNTAFGFRDYSFQITATPPPAELHITKITIPEPGRITLAWTSESETSYDVFYSIDLVDFTQKLPTVFISQGDATEDTFDNPLPDSSALFFRVKKR